MNRMTFLKDKLPFLAAQLLVIVFFGFVLMMLHASAAAIVLTCGLAVLLMLTEMAWEFIHRVRYYERLYHMLDQMEHKQYIAAMLEPPTFGDAAVLCDILQQATKAMNDEIAGYEKTQKEYREYIEQWIHEIKVPISCISLLCGNNPNDATRSIAKENTRIESYVEQALYYARSTNLEKDYIIRSVQLDLLIKACAKKYSRELIACNTKLAFDGLDVTVYADPKWLDFVLGQIISNSIKYKREGNLTLSILAQKQKDQVVLSIADNGIGIPECDMSRITEKGFTGENGRRFAKSTGIGLYLCRQLCEKMSLGFFIDSEQEIGTTVRIVFPILSILEDHETENFGVQ